MSERKYWSLYLPAGDQPVFRHVPAPTATQLQALVQQIAERTGKLLEKRGFIERDMENARLTTDGSGGPLDDLIGHSITYRIAVGPRAGGFSLHAGTDIAPGRRAPFGAACHPCFGFPGR